jgi:hypothetical protein
MNIAQSLMAGAGRSDPLMCPVPEGRPNFPVKRPSGTMRGRGLQVPSDESLGYFQGAPPGQNISKTPCPVMYLKLIIGVSLNFSSL